MSSSLLWERWSEVDALLSAALEVPPEERIALVRRTVTEEGPFLDLVLRMVQRLTEDQERVTAPPESLLADAFGATGEGDRATDLAPGTAIGRYRILRRRARGGMATVYEAERSDGVYRQTVALKVLRRGLDTEDLVERFRTERQILSSLSHPNIARLLDGGSLPDGRPFLVMELVEGQPITRYADERRLGIPARLALFLDAADAVHAAHRQLVVHRDIKPSNILVDGDGRVKLLDFGIAKLLAGDAEHTQAGQRALTPEYASPEQLRGDRVTTATDVYQLGLLLRELLTGVRPGGCDPRSGPAPMAPSRLAGRASASASAEARAAERATTPPRLARRLRGDLDIIVGKALRAEPEQRYASAAELAADLRRHLTGMPVLAHHESVAYRVRKFVTRHRWAVAAAGVAVLLLTVYAGTLTVQARRIAAERDRAELEARKAGQVTEFLVDLFAAADPNRAGGDDVTARELLDEGARRLDDERIEEPAVRAAMLGAIGRSYHQLGLYDEAREHLERALAPREAGALPEDEALVRNLNALGVALALSDRRRALEVFAEALRVAERSLGPDHPLVGKILPDYSIVVSQLHPGDPRVERMQARAVAILRAAPGDVREDLANALTVWGRGRPPEVGMPRIREALELRRAIHPERHTAVAASLNDLALVTEPVDPMAADTLMARALEILTAIHGRRHGTLLEIINNLAALRRDRGAYAEAEPLYRQAIALRREFYPEQQVQLAFPLYGLGLVLVETGRAAEGEVSLREALAILEREIPQSPLVTINRAAIGRALARQRRFADAEQMLLPAAERLLQAPGVVPEKVRLLQWVVALYQDWGRAAPAGRHERLLDSLTAATRVKPSAGGR